MQVVYACMDVCMQVCECMYAYVIFVCMHGVQVMSGMYVSTYVWCVCTVNNVGTLCMQVCVDMWLY